MQRMKVFSRILGGLAFVCTLLLAASWLNAVHGKSVADADAKRFLDEAELKMAKREAERDSQRSDLRKAERDLEFYKEKATRAILAGRDAKPFIRQAAINARLRDITGEMLYLEAKQDEHGGDPDIKGLLDRGSASEASGKVYAAVKTRDGQFAYAVGFLWIAFGFAFALSGRQTAEKV